MTTLAPLTAVELERSLDAVADWVERHHYRGWEPFDGLSSRVRPLVRGHQLGERILQQLVRRSPFNVRPWLGVTPKESTKGRGFMASGYLARFRAEPKPGHLEKAIACLEWLDRHRAARFAHHGWSNHFDFVSRAGGYGKDEPILVWTGLIGQAYLDAFELTGTEAFLRVAQSVCEWILALPRESTERGECLSYRPGCVLSIHNANMVGAAMLARTAMYTGDDRALRVARAAMAYSCGGQRADGSWWYGEAGPFHWIDNFHTGYNLESLKTYLDATGDDAFRDHLDRGLAFFKAHFIDAAGRPRYYHHGRRYPIDIQCAAQAIDTLASVSAVDPSSVALAARVAAWTVRHMQDPDGHFHYRHYRLVQAKTPMLHWGQATMFKALARLHLVMTAGHRALPVAAAAGGASSR